MHVAGMDSFTKGLKAAQKILDDGVFDQFMKDRYSSYSEGIGKEISEGKADFISLEKHALQLKPIENASGMQEYIASV